MTSEEPISYVSFLFICFSVSGARDVEFVIILRDHHLHFCFFVYVHMYSKANYNKIIIKLEVELDMFRAKSSTCDADSLWTDFRNLLSKLVDKSIPCKHLKDKPKPD